MHIIPVADTDFGAISTKGMSFGVAESLVTGLYPLTNPYASAAGAPNLNGLGGASGVVLGTPVFTNSSFSLSVPNSVDYIASGLQDLGAYDMTFLFAVKNTDTAAGWLALSNSSTDSANPGTDKGAKGIVISATSATAVTFKDSEYVTASSSNKNTTLTVNATALLNNWQVFCVRRATVGGTVTRDVFNLTASGITAPATTTSTSPIAPNLTQQFRFGGGFGVNCAKASFALNMLYQTAAGGGGALTNAQISILYARVQAWLANRPTPIIA